MSDDKQASMNSCPFCGYKSRYTEIVFKEGQVSISCPCGASMSIGYDAVSRDGFIRFYEDDSYAHELEKEVLRKWNERVKQ